MLQIARWDVAAGLFRLDELIGGGGVSYLH